MAVHAYIIHEDASMTGVNLGAGATVEHAVDELKMQMRGCAFVEFDMAACEDGRSWTIIMDEEAPYHQSMNTGMGGYLMQLERPWYGKLAVVLVADDERETLCDLPAPPVPGNNPIAIYEHLTEFRNAWRRAHALPDAK